MRSWPLVVACTLIAIALVVLMAYLFAVADQMSRLVSLPVVPISLLVLPALAIAGVIPGLILARRGVRPALMVLCMAVLVTLAIPQLSIGLAKAMAPLFQDVVYNRLVKLPEGAVRSPEEERDRRVQVARSAHYEQLRQRFQVPQRVIAADRGQLLLEGDVVVKLTGVYWNQARFADFDSLGRAALVGREVMVQLPDRAAFEQLYVPGARSALFPGHGAGYGMVPVIAYLDNTPLNERHASLPSGP